VITIYFNVLLLKLHCLPDFLSVSHNAGLLAYLQCLRKNGCAKKNSMELSVQRQNYPRASQRQPGNADYLAFFFGIPLALAFLFSLVGIRLIQGMSYIDGLGYMVLHMLLAWWLTSAGAWTVRFLCRSWQPPVIALCIMGFIASMIPAAVLFQKLGDLYASWYPVFAANRADVVVPSWTLEYLAHFARYSIPALPLFMAGVYGYRALTGVDWLGYAAATDETGQAENAAVDGQTARQVARAGLISGSKLAQNAEIIAIKAEQHYIHIWSDQGKDMVRYRFKDVPFSLHGCNGEQVHRSWWVNFDQVRDVRKAGRSLELEMTDGSVVPVSLAHRNIVLRALNVELH